MSRILIISNMYPSNQHPYAGIFVKNQYDFFIKKGLNIHIFYLKRKFTSTVGSLRKYFLAFTAFVPHLFRNYSIIHIHYFYPLITLASLYKLFHPKVQIIVTYHGSDINHHINSRYKLFIFSALAKHINYNIAVGNELARNITRKLETHVDTIMSAGVDEKIFFEEDKDVIYDFIFVGSFNQRKGVDLLIESLDNLDEKIHFCFVGQGPYLNTLQALSKNRKITILSSQSQSKLRKLYNSSKFLILPSRNEPFGLVVTEAAFCGVPAIVTNIGGLAEQIVDGENGWIVKNNDQHHLVSVIQHAFKMDDQSYLTMKNKALLYNRRHSLQSICDFQITLYNTMMNQNSNNHAPEYHQ